MLDPKTNFREKYADTICPCCRAGDDNQQHLLSCSKLEEDGEIACIPTDYQDLFRSDLVKQINISRILKKRFSKRKNIPLPIVAQVILVLWSAVMFIADFEINIYIYIASRDLPDFQ